MHPNCTGPAPHHFVRCVLLLNKDKLQSTEESRITDVCLMFYHKHYYTVYLLIALNSRPCSIHLISSEQAVRQKFRSTYITGPSSRVKFLSSNFLGVKKLFLWDTVYFHLRWWIRFHCSEIILSYHRAKPRAVWHQRKFNWFSIDVTLTRTMG